MTYFGPALDPPMGGSGRKTTALVRDNEYFIPTKFHQNSSISLWWRSRKCEKFTDGRRTDGRTDDGRCAMTIAHPSLRFRWAKKERDYTKTSPQLPLHNNCWSNNSHPTDMVKPVYGHPTFPLTTTAVLSKEHIPIHNHQMPLLNLENFQKCEPLLSEKMEIWTGAWE